MNKKLEQKIFNLIIEDNINSFRKEHEKTNFSLNHKFGNINTEDGVNEEFFNIIYLAIDWHSLKILEYILNFPELKINGNKEIFKSKISPFSLMLLRGMKEENIIKQFIKRDDFDLFEKDNDNVDFRYYLADSELAQKIIHNYNKNKFKKNIKTS